MNLSDAITKTTDISSLSKASSDASDARKVTPAEPGFILLVEDDFMLRGSLATVLGAEGYRVECEANALDALRRLERPPKPSLILLDIMLPYMDGLEFRALQRNMRDLADIPVIVITAVGIRPEIAEDLNLVTAFSKPLDRPRLLAAIRRYCLPSAS
jgi:CheY-like chemotaxis protein